jgi:hypothetical protein
MVPCFCLETRITDVLDFQNISLPLEFTYARFLGHAASLTTILHLPAYLTGDNTQTKDELCGNTAFVLS